MYRQRYRDSDTKDARNYIHVMNPDMENGTGHFLFFMNSYVVKSSTGRMYTCVT